MNIKKLVDWVQEDGSKRTISIEIGERGNQNHLRIWAYDYELMTGKILNSIDEIDNINLCEMAIKELERNCKEQDELIRKRREVKK